MVLYCSRFQAILIKIDNNLAIEYDKQIKDYIKAIRIKRDELYRTGILPVNAIIETTNYKPQL